MTCVQRFLTVFVLLSMVGAPRSVAAQSMPTGSAPAPASKGYVEAIAQSAFGTVTSQAYGGEFGFAVRRDLHVFVEAGQVRNVATATISSAAQTIAGALTQVQSSAVSYSVKQPATIFAAGLRYGFAMPSAPIAPYLTGGAGVAQVKNKVAFQLGGVDASGTLAQYVTLGDDLSGKQTKPMVTAGAGVIWPAYHQLIVDIQFRYGRIFADGAGINIVRAGLGLGMRF